MTGAYCTVNGVPVVHGEIVRPRVGPWIADLWIDSPTLAGFTGAVKIEIPQYGLAFVGDAFRSDLYKNAVWMRAVAGAGGMDTLVGPKAYRNVPLRIVLQDILAAAGERASPTCDPATLGTVLPFWHVSATTARRALFGLLKAAGSPSWRFLPDGSLWIGPEQWPAASLDWRLVEYNPHLGRVTIAADNPTVSPGQTFDFNGQTRRVSSVTHQIGSEELRLVLLFEGEAEGDRLKIAINSYVRDLFPLVDFQQPWQATVVSQNADGSVDLNLDDPRFGGMQGVPIWTGLPIASLRVLAGTRCVVQWAGGDPMKPMVTGFPYATSPQSTELGGDAQVDGKLTVQGAAVIGPSGVTLLSGLFPVAKEGSPLAGTAGPYALAGTVAIGGGSPNVKVP